MKIISFAWTTAPLLAGAKTMTWREWTADYAATFHEGDLVQAWDKSPRSHGKRIGTVRILSVEKGTLRDLTFDDYAAEGLKWMAEHPESWPKTIFGHKTSPVDFSRAFFDQRCRDADPGYIVRFEWLGPVEAVAA